MVRHSAGSRHLRQCALDFWLVNQPKSSSNFLITEEKRYGDYLWTNPVPGHWYCHTYARGRAGPADPMTESNRFQHSDAVETAWHFTEQLPHGRDLGMKVVRVEDNQASIRLSPQPWMFEGDDDREEVCTSILYSLADSACGLAVFAEAQELTPIATLDLRMDYLRPADGDRALLAVATCLHLTEEIAFIHCDILSHGGSQPLATGSATFVRNTDGQRFQAVAGEK
tara:strand:- start:5312 stop:5989 length:678 start_codon:yes stop_codon:yes gene_type:complete